MTKRDIIRVIFQFILIVFICVSCCETVYFIKNTTQNDNIHNQYNTNSQFIEKSQNDSVECLY